MSLTFLRTSCALVAVLGSLSILGTATAQDGSCPNCPGGGDDSFTSVYGGGGRAPVRNYCNKYNNLGDCTHHKYGQHDLFYNYYMGNNCGGMGAQLYLSPRPVPPFVGNTYYTYQPFLPQEHMYAHHRTYHRYYNGGQGLTRTSAIYYAPLFRR